MVGLHSTGWEQQNVVGNLVIQPLVFLGGVFYSVDALSQPWRALTHADPIFYMVVAARHGTLGTSRGARRAVARHHPRARRRHAHLGLGDLPPRGGDPHLTRAAAPGQRVASAAAWTRATSCRRTWALYRAHWQHLITIAAVIYVPLGAVSALLALVGWPGVVVGNILSLAAIFLVQGALVKAVEDVRDGRADLSVGDTLRHAGDRLVVLAGAGLLAAIGILIGLRC